MKEKDGKRDSKKGGGWGGGEGDKQTSFVFVIEMCRKHVSIEQ